MAAEPGARVRLARRFVTRSAAATEALGEALGRRLEPDAVLALHGELGSGKTTLVRGLARGLDVVDPVSSPTFTLMHTYEGRVPVYHLDAWMTERGDAFLAEGGAEWLAGEGVAVVEWAERVAAWLPAAHLRVRLEHAVPEGAGPSVAGPDGLRRIELAVVDPAGLRDPLGELARRLAALRVPAGLEEQPAGASGAGGGPARGESP
jgi:tRNA threonylcarbamoyladenosine biosynthesis protein TsaE